MTKIDELRAEHELAEQEAVALSNEYDEARWQVADQYRERVQEANRRAADAQKTLADYEAASGLLDRPDGQAVADQLGLTLPVGDDEG